MKHTLLFAALAAAWQGFAAAPEITVSADALDSYYPIQGRIAGTAGNCRLTLLHREFGLAGFSLYNPSDETMYCRIIPSGLDGLQIISRESLHIRARQGQLPADLLPELSRDGVVVIPPGENRQILLEIDTRKAETGIYCGALKAVNLKDDSAAEREITVEVIARSLPLRHPLHVMTWDCSLRKSAGKERENLLIELQNHYVNNFHVLEKTPWKADADGNLTSGPDFSVLDRTLDFLKGKGMLLLRCAALNPGKAPDIRTEAGAKAYGNFVKALVAHMRGKGFNYDDYALYPMDENTGDIFLALAKAAKKADPAVMIFANPVKGKEEILRVTVDGNYCEYLQFSTSYLDRTDIIEKVRGHLKIVSAYWCPVVQKKFYPEWYRNMGQTAWRLNLNGIGYWTSLWMRGNEKLRGFPWDDFRGKIASDVTVYPGRNYENVPSRRWKAFRAGLEDFLVFDLVRADRNRGLEKKIAAALDPETGSPEKRIRVRAEAVKFLKKGN